MMKFVFVGNAICISHMHYFEKSLRGIGVLFNKLEKLPRCNCGIHSGWFDNQTDWQLFNDLRDRIASFVRRKIGLPNAHDQMLMQMNEKIKQVKHATLIILNEQSPGVWCASIHGGAATPLFRGFICNNMEKMVKSFIILHAMDLVYIEFGEKGAICPFC